MLLEWLDLAEVERGVMELLFIELIVSLRGVLEGIFSRELAEERSKYITVSKCII